jgi:hypothetical protein
MLNFLKNWFGEENKTPQLELNETLIFIPDFSWRTDPTVKSKFVTQYPDDIQVVVHEGDMRITQRPLELIWVKITGHAAPYYKGFLLNQPQNLATLHQGSEIIFKIETGCEHPVRVLEEYIKDRKEWIVKPCEGCGLNEAFSPVAALTKLSFPNNPPDSTVEAFTSRCNLCGGTQVIYHKDVEWD